MVQYKLRNFLAVFGDFKYYQYSMKLYQLSTKHSAPTVF